MKKELILPTILYVTGLFAVGGFYNWGFALLGMLCSGGAFLYVLWGSPGKRSLQCTDPVRKGMLLIPVMIAAIAFLSQIWAVDKSYNLQGIQRDMAVLAWFWLCFSMEESEKDFLLNLLPPLGVLQVAAGLLVLPFENISGIFWQSARLGGFFEYANSFALFLLLAIVIESENERKNKGLHWAFQLGNLLGLLLTGSRSVLILLLVWALYRLIAVPKMRKGILLTGVGAAGVSVGYVLVTGSFQNFGRIFTLSSSNSTVWGRLLYDYDGLHMLLRHPFGLGYMGYYYLQGAEQTGVYTIRFAHNDFLQMGLDGGLISLILLLVYLLWQLVRGQMSREKKELLALICLASLVDFHLQYLFFLMTAGLLLDLDPTISLSLQSNAAQSKSAKKSKPNSKTNRKKPQGSEMLLTTVKFVSAVEAIALAVLLAAYIGEAGGNYDLTLSILPEETAVLETELKAADSAVEVSAIAEQILDGNKYDTLARRNLAYVAAWQLDAGTAIDQMDQVLRNNRYNTDLYAEYDSLLADLEEQLLADGQEEEAKLCRLRREELPRELAELKNETSFLAYRINEQPEFNY